MTLDTERVQRFRAQTAATRRAAACALYIDGVRGADIMAVTGVGLAETKRNVDRLGYPVRDRYTHTLPLATIAERILDDPDYPCQSWTRHLAAWITGGAVDLTQGRPVEPRRRH